MAKRFLGLAVALTAVAVFVIKPTFDLEGQAATVCKMSFPREPTRLHTVFISFMISIISFLLKCKSRNYRHYQFLFGKNIDVVASTVNGMTVNG